MVDEDYPCEDEGYYSDYHSSVTSCNDQNQNDLKYYRVILAFIILISVIIIIIIIIIITIIIIIIIIHLTGCVFTSTYSCI